MLQQIQDIDKYLVEISVGQFRVARSSREGVVKINIESEGAAINGWHDAETCAKFGWIKIKLRMPAGTEAKSFGDRIEAILQRAQHHHIAGVGYQRIGDRKTKEKQVGREHVP